jgi:hypothetical protein
MEEWGRGARREVADSLSYEARNGIRIRLGT